jgi:sugar/nucleoside kinase (ribokinase family)
MMLKPNDREAVWGAFGNSAEEVTLEQAEAAGLALSQRSGHPVFVTVGERGILVCHAGESRRIPAVPVRGEIDIVGAGDSALAGIAAALAAGANPAEAAIVGNLVASVTIRQIGTTGTASQSQVLQALEEWRRQ